MTNHKQERAQRIVDATMELTLRPKSGDRARVIAAALRWVVDEYEYFRDDDGFGAMVIHSGDIRDLVDELEALEELAQENP